MHARVLIRAFHLFLLVVIAGFPMVGISAQDGGSYEVWLMDQSDTVEEGGGTLYIYEGDSLAGGSAEPEVIDLGGEVLDLCFDQTGSYPGRPHMVLFNQDNTHALISFVTTGHVLFMDAAERAPITCIDAGEQAHAAFPSADGTYAIIANQDGKLLQRVSTDYEANEFVLEDDATVDLAGCTTPSGARCEDAVMRPDNAPICPVIDRTSTYTFVTLRGGGMLVLDSTATPMEIVAEYDAETVHPNGCGGIETNGKMYLNSGGGSPTIPFESDLYAFPVGEYSRTPQEPNRPAPVLVYSHDDREQADSHGPVLAGDGEYLWVTDRASNLIVVVDTVTDEVVNEIEIAGDMTDDPAPDLMDVSPDGQWVVISLRGTTPLTANSPEHHNAVGSTPGLALIQVTEDGVSGEMVAVHRITNMVDGAETADPHGIRVRPVD